MIGKLREAARDLYPGYFALVMATGIVSLAGYFLGMGAVALGLLWLNVGFYAALWALTLARLALFRGALRRDLGSHTAGPGFFTLVAGTCVLGTQAEVIAGAHAAARALLLLGAGLWAVLIYAFFTAVTVREEKPSLGEGLHGGWLLAVVSTQSVSVLATLLAPHFGESAQGVLFASLCLYLLGGMFYLLIITLIFYRFTFVSLRAQELTPPYWINMGAVAITTMAGARLLLRGGDWELLGGMRPFLTGFTLFFWAIATWWIPLLVILGDWRHLIKRIPLAYHPTYWAMVFPLGMYTAATFQLAHALEFPALLVIPRYFIYAALAAWVVVFAAMAARVGRVLLAPAAPGPEEVPPVRAGREEKSL